MVRNIILLATMMVAMLFCGQALAKVTNSCDGVAISFDKQAFVTQAQETSLTDAIKTKASGASAEEIICASVGIDDITTADIISALRNAGFDSPTIDLAAKKTGLDPEEVALALAPNQTLPTTTGTTPGTNASPSVP